MCLTTKETYDILITEDEGGNRRTPTKGMCVSHSPLSSPLFQKDFRKNLKKGLTNKTTSAIINIQDEGDDGASARNLIKTV